VLLARQLTVLAPEGGASGPVPPGAQASGLPELVGRAQLVIAIGGDGTLLYAAGLVAESGIPLLGINRGRLGFLTDVMPQDMVSCIDAVLAGECAEERRRLLNARLTAPSGGVAGCFALNDVVFNRLETGRMLDFETHVDGRYVNSHGADGLVVASATGSTAYALSCGGPIVEPHLEVFVVAPICPHTLSDRPIVVSSRSVIEIRLLDRHDIRAQLVCDGAVLSEITPQDRLEVKQAAERITLLHPVGHDYYRLLRSKLHWGRGSHDHSR
jgi:NAD+ kinase